VFNNPDAYTGRRSQEPETVSRHETALDAFSECIEAHWLLKAVDGSQLSAPLSYDTCLLARDHDALDVWEFDLHRFQKVHPRKYRQAQVYNDKVHLMSRHLVYGFFRIERLQDCDFKRFKEIAQQLSKQMIVVKYQNGFFHVDFPVANWLSSE
jgi:hypothetical protein